MPDLKIYLLGSVRIEVDGVPAKVDRRKGIALLAYLAVTRRGHQRNELATLFWPEYDQTQGRTALRRTLISLKAALDGDWLDVDWGSIGLKPSDDLWIDVEQFHKRIADCDAVADPHSADCIAALSEAVKLYQGDFLAGFTLRDSPAFDEWQFFETDSLRSELSNTLEQLVTAHSARGEFKQAIPVARRWLALDPMHEPAHQSLIRLYTAAGQPTAALRQYRECVRIFEKELGIPLHDETIRLYEAIRDTRDTRDVREPAATGASSEAETPTVKTDYYKSTDTPAEPISVSALADSSEAQSGVIYEQHGPILSFIFKDVSLASIDHWATTLINTLTQETGRAYFILSDFSDKPWGPTPYARERAQAVLTCRPDLKGYFALVMPHNSFSGHMMQLFLRGQDYENIIVRSFFSRDAGLSWLQKMAQALK